MELKEFIDNRDELSIAALGVVAKLVEKELAKLAEDFTSGQTALLNEIEELRTRVKALENTTAQDKAD